MLELLIDSVMNIKKKLEKNMLADHMLSNNYQNIFLQLKESFKRVVEKSM